MQSNFTHHNAKYYNAENESQCDTIKYKQCAMQCDASNSMLCDMIQHDINFKIKYFINHSRPTI